ncbi:MAG TPA: hypothetical protein VMW25_03155 [Clostridia bacterium]|nr:hypothetical protein [Clostridia bacterium]
MRILELEYSLASLQAASREELGLLYKQWETRSEAVLKIARELKLEDFYRRCLSSELKIYCFPVIKRKLELIANARRGLGFEDEWVEEIRQPPGKLQEELLANRGIFRRLSDEKIIFVLGVNIGYWLLKMRETSKKRESFCISRPASEKVAVPSPR